MVWVPQSGRMGLGVSILSCDGRVVVGVATDEGLVIHPEPIAEAFETEFDAMRAWVARGARPRVCRPGRLWAGRGSRPQASRRT